MALAHARAPLRPEASPTSAPRSAQAGGLGNAARAEALNGRQAMDRARRGAPRPLPFRDQMEQSFGQDFGDVQCFFGQAAALGSIGAGAAAQGSVITFATDRPSKEQVAHEAAHVVQQRGGLGQRGGTGGGLSAPGGGVEGEARDVAKRAAAGESVQVEEAAGPEVHRDILGIGNAIGDALDLREGEAELDAREDAAEALEAFRAQTFAPLIDHQPSSGVGMFDVAFNGATGAMVVTLKVSYNFVNGDPTRVAAGFRPEEFQWTPAEQDQWKARYQADVSAQWSQQFVFACTRQYWEALQVSCTVQVLEDAADPHFVLTVGKYPPDAGMAQSSVCPPGTSHDAGGNLCPQNPADAAGNTPNNGSGRFDNNDMRPEQKLDWGNAVVAIPFKRGSAALGTAGKSATQGVAASLKADPAARVALTGRASVDHRRGADATQGAVENMDTARARSNAVRDELVGAGISGGRVQQRNQGEAGAGRGDAWCRVDAQVGNHEMQSPALHETGHMLGLDDEYAQTGAPAGTGVSPAYQAMITATTGEVVTRGSNEGAMSMGSTVKRWNYSSFMEALRLISGVNEWTI